jgi:hypothetical protein
MLSEGDLERFWKYVEKTDTCWLWKASVNTYGYGCFWWNRKQHQSHRISWYIKHNKHSEKLLLHSCDNAACVNPDHLREGTQSDNMKDKVKRRRQAIGEKVGSSRLKEWQVLDILKKHSEGISISELTKQYPVSDTAIKYIIIGRNWSYLHKGKA